MLAWLWNKLRRKHEDSLPFNRIQSETIRHYRGWTHITIVFEPDSRAPYPEAWVAASDSVRRDNLCWSGSTNGAMEIDVGPL